MSSNTAVSVLFTAPRQISLQEETLPPLPPGQVRVQTRLSAISPGTEMLVYRGQFPSGLAADTSLAALAGELAYPLRYGYCTAGRVAQAGSPALDSWVGQSVFSFQPHTSHFDAAPGELIPLPGEIPFEDAVFLPNMETAVNFVMDGSPVVGERVVVFGQGIVGLLTAGLLARFPLACLVTLDHYPRRRAASLAQGAQHSLDPGAPDTGRLLETLLPGGADLVYELSGSPAALDSAIACTGFEGRLVIGSWYGQKRASLDLGGRFHRSRIRLISSQVSTLASAFSGRWTKARRFEVAWEMIRQMKPSRFITHRFLLAQAAQAYDLIDRRPEETIQVIIEYDT